PLTRSPRRASQPARRGDSHFVLRPHGQRRALRAFPTRRSSDLGHVAAMIVGAGVGPQRKPELEPAGLIERAATFDQPGWLEFRLDRKSTRLNSSHDQISYAVFCLKKKIIRSSAGG